MSTCQSEPPFPLDKFCKDLTALSSDTPLGLADLAKRPLSSSELAIILRKTKPLPDDKLLRLLENSNPLAIRSFLFAQIWPQADHVFAPHPSIIPTVVSLLVQRDRALLTSPPRAALELTVSTVSPEYWTALIENVPAMAWWYRDSQPPGPDLHVDSLINERFRATGIDRQLAWTLFKDRQSTTTTHPDRAISLNEFCVVLCALARTLEVAP
jgi:hypothetical protein